MKGNIICGAYARTWFANNPDKRVKLANKPYIEYRYNPTSLCLEKTTVPIGIWEPVFFSEDAVFIIPDNKAQEGDS